jgi:hypothetical protein
VRTEINEEVVKLHGGEVADARLNADENGDAIKPARR